MNHYNPIQGTTWGQRVLLVGASSHWSELAGYVRHALPEEMKAAVPTQVKGVLKRKRHEGRGRKRGGERGPRGNKRPFPFPSLPFPSLPFPSIPFPSLPFLLPTRLPVPPPHPFSSPLPPPSSFSLPDITEARRGRPRCPSAAPHANRCFAVRGTTRD